MFKDSQSAQDTLATHWFAFCTYFRNVTFKLLNLDKDIIFKLNTNHIFEK